MESDYNGKINASSVSGGIQHSAFSIQHSGGRAAAVPLSILHMGHSGPVQNARCSKKARIKMHAARKRPGSKRTLLDFSPGRTEQARKRPGQNGAMLENARVIFEQCCKTPGSFSSKVQKNRVIFEQCSKTPGRNRAFRGRAG